MQGKTPSETMPNFESCSEFTQGSNTLMLSKSAFFVSGKLEENVFLKSQDKKGVVQRFLSSDEQGLLFKGIDGIVLVNKTHHD